MVDLIIINGSRTSTVCFFLVVLSDVVIQIAIDHYASHIIMKTARLVYLKPAMTYRNLW